MSKMSHFGLLFFQRLSGSHNVFRPAERSTMTCGTFHLQAHLETGHRTKKSRRHWVTTMTLRWKENLAFNDSCSCGYSTITVLFEFFWARQATGGHRRSPSSLWCSEDTVNKLVRVKLEQKLLSLLKETDWVNSIIWSRRDHHSIKITQSVCWTSDLRSKLQSARSSEKTLCASMNIWEFFKILQGYSPNWSGTFLIHFTLLKKNSTYSTTAYMGWLADLITEDQAL